MTDNRAVSRGLKLLCLGQVVAALILLPFPLLRAAAFAATLLLAVAGLYRMGCRIAIPVVLAALAAGLLPIPSMLSYAAVEVLRLAAFCLVYAAAARRMEAAGTAAWGRRVQGLCILCTALELAGYFCAALYPGSEIPKVPMMLCMGGLLVSTLLYLAFLVRASEALKGCRETLQPKDSEGGIV